MNHWFLGKGQGPLRDGRPSFEEELAKMPPIADSCYRTITHPDGTHSHCPPVSVEPSPPTPKPDEPSPD